MAITVGFLPAPWFASMALIPSLVYVFWIWGSIFSGSRTRKGDDCLRQAAFFVPNDWIGFKENLNRKP